MVRGGISDRKCNICKQNGTNLMFNCPYIKDLIIDENVYTDFPEFDDLDLIVYECPRYYYIENQELYQMLKSYRKRDTKNAIDEFYLRISLQSFDLYLSLLESKNS